MCQEQLRINPWFSQRSDGWFTPNLSVWFHQVWKWSLHRLMWDPGIIYDLKKKGFQFPKFIFGQYTLTIIAGVHSSSSQRRPIRRALALLQWATQKLLILNAAPIEGMTSSSLLLFTTTTIFALDPKEMSSRQQNSHLAGWTFVIGSWNSPLQFVVASLSPFADMYRMIFSKYVDLKRGGVTVTPVKGGSNHVWNTCPSFKRPF